MLSGTRHGPKDLANTYSLNPYYTTCSGCCHDLPSRCDLCKVWTSRWRSRTHRQPSGSEPICSSPLHTASCSPSVTFRIQEGIELPFWGNPSWIPWSFPLTPVGAQPLAFHQVLSRSDQPQRMNSQLTLCLGSWSIITKLSDLGKVSPAVLFRGLCGQKLRAPTLTQIPIMSLPHLAFWLCVYLLTCPYIISPTVNTGNSSCSIWGTCGSNDVIPIEF